MGWGGGGGGGAQCPNRANPGQKRKVKVDQKLNRMQVYAKNGTLHETTFRLSDAHSTT